MAETMEAGFLFSSEKTATFWGASLASTWNFAGGGSAAPGTATDFAEVLGTSLRTAATLARAALADVAFAGAQSGAAFSDFPG
ncbi:MAG TPA: hypothetical protein VHX61_20800 [Rhizomicrobium sp.]|nr:hypothetical protein [Rhizomicrobium sp.]